MATRKNTMAKNSRKKRRKIQDINKFANFSNITGLNDDRADTLNDCLVEMATNNSQDIATATPGGDETLCRQQQHPSWIRQMRISFEDTAGWNRNFKSWVNGGLYPAGLLPNIDQEIARNFKVKELSSFLLTNNDFVSGKDIRMATFERWLLDSKHEEDREERNGCVGIVDPVIPLRSSPDSKASQRLLLELISKSIARKDAETVVSKLCRLTNMCCQELSTQDGMYRRQSPLKNGDRISVSTKSSTSSIDDDDVIIIHYSRKRWKKPFCFKINAWHYQKLRDRFMKIHSNTTTTSSIATSIIGETDDCTSNKTIIELADRSFNVIILALLLRYSALSGGQLLDDLRGGGMQGAIHEAAFDVLEKHFSKPVDFAACKSQLLAVPWLEGFSSPFNATLPYFASAFPDLDWHFGSVGRFLECNFDGYSGREEFCQCNPPFSPGIMLSMANHITSVLQKADKNSTELTFCVIVPSADNRSKTNKNQAVAKSAAEASFRNMTSSIYCIKHIILKARDHGWVEGSQHLRSTKYKQSLYDTSIIILQSPRRGTNETRLENLESDLRLAFATKHNDELIERKRKSSATNH